MAENDDAVLSLAGKAESYWVAMVAGVIPDYAPLDGDLAVDVAIVGGGIVGLTAAELLARAGKRVALIEALKLVHRGVQKIHPFDVLASPEPRKRGVRRQGRMNLLSAPVH